MKRFEVPKSTEKLPFPKPVRKKRQAKFLSKGRVPAKQNAADNQKSGSGHDDVLFGCIDVLQQSYHEYSFLHVPDALYHIIAIDGDLGWVLDRCLGPRRAICLKRSLGDAFKGMLDLAVWSPVLPNGLKLSMVGEVKVGNDVVRKGQSRWNRNEPVRVWSAVDAFQEDMVNFEREYRNSQNGLERKPF